MNSNYPPHASAVAYEAHGDLDPIVPMCIVCGEAPAIEDDCCFVHAFDNFVQELSAAWLAGDVPMQRRYEGYIQDLAGKGGA